MPVPINDATGPREHLWVKVSPTDDISAHQPLLGKLVSDPSAVEPTGTPALPLVGWGEVLHHPPCALLRSLRRARKGPVAPAWGEQRHTDIQIVYVP